MSLNIDLLEDVVIRGGKLIAACPVCRENGGDRRGEHLVCYSPDGDGRFACVCGCPAAEIFALVGSHLPGVVQPRPARVALRHRNSLPTLHRPTESELKQIASVRRWRSIDGLVVLADRGLLFVGHVRDGGDWHKAWVITDETRRNAQARRLDGRAWSGIDAKAKTLPGVENARWPIGAAQVAAGRVVVLCEGQPDFCASMIVAAEEGCDLDQIAPVCMTGAGAPIPGEALPMFRDTRVLVPVHVDEKGREAAQRWKDQLYGVGAEQVILVNFAAISATKPIKDLADFAACRDHPRLFAAVASALGRPEILKSPIIRDQMGRSSVTTESGRESGCEHGIPHGR